MGASGRKPSFRVVVKGLKRLCTDATTGVAKCRHTVAKISKDSKKAHGKVIPGVKLGG